MNWLCIAPRHRIVIHIFIYSCFSPSFSSLFMHSIVSILISFGCCERVSITLFVQHNVVSNEKTRPRTSIYIYTKYTCGGAAVKIYLRSFFVSHLFFVCVFLFFSRLLSIASSIRLILSHHIYFSIISLFIGRRTYRRCRCRYRCENRRHFAVHL